jgi:copper chaperone CopZ
MRKLLCLAVLFGFGLFAQAAEQVELKIKGMVCEGGCVTRVDRALSRVDGVTERKVEIGKAKVKFDASRTNRKALVKAIEKAGFKVEKEEKD